MKQIQPFQKHWLQLTSIVVCRLKYQINAFINAFGRYSSTLKAFIDGFSVDWQLVLECALYIFESYNGLVANYRVTSILRLLPEGRTAIYGGSLIHCVPVTQYGDMDLCQYCLRYRFIAWRPQAISLTNVDLSSVRCSDIHLKRYLGNQSQELVWILVLKIF